MIELNVHMSDSELKRSLETLDALKEKAVKNAFKRATIKLSKWFITHIARDIAKQYGLGASHFKKFRIRVTSGIYDTRNTPATVWIGVAPIAAHLIGRAKADNAHGGGVWVKDYYFKGAFVRRDREFAGQVWARLSRKRLPIDVQKVDIRQGSEIAVKRLVARGEERFKTILMQEIRFELSKIK